MATNNHWKTMAFGLGALGAVTGVWAALRWGNRYLDQFEDISQDEHARGEYLTTSEGWRLHYTVTGSGSPVVLIHGFMDSLETWRRNIGALAVNHRVYALDVLGFGASDRARAHVYTLKQQARLLHEFFDQLGIARATLIGHSMGGALALQFAYDFPDQVHKLVLIAPATYIYANFPRNGVRPVPRQVSRGVLGIYEKFSGGGSNSLKHAYGDPQQITTESVEIRSRMLRVRGTHDALISMSKSRREADVPLHLDQIGAPTLIIWGRLDRVVPASHAANHYRELPNARIECIEQAGHLPHEEAPAQVNQLIHSFLVE